MNTTSISNPEHLTDNCTPLVCFQELLKYSVGSDRTSELQGALAAMLDLLKSVNDSMHQIAITGYEVTFCGNLMQTYLTFYSSVLSFSTLQILLYG